MKYLSENFEGDSGLVDHLSHNGMPQAALRKHLPREGRQALRSGNYVSHRGAQGQREQLKTQFSFYLIGWLILWLHHAACGISGDLSSQTRVPAHSPRVGSKES